MKEGTGYRCRRFALELACDVLYLAGGSMAELGSRRAYVAGGCLCSGLRSRSDGFRCLGDLGRDLFGLRDSFEDVRIGRWCDYWSHLRCFLHRGHDAGRRAFDASRQGRETQRLLGDVDGLAEGFGLLNCGLVGAARVLRRRVRIVLIFGLEVSGIRSDYFQWSSFVL